MLFDKQELLKSYSDQTGRFLIPSSRCNHCIFVLHHHATNTVHAKAIPNRQAASVRNAWEKTHKKLVQQGHAPNLHILDNKCSQELKDAFTKHNILLSKECHQKSIVQTQRRKSDPHVQKSLHNHSLCCRLQLSCVRMGSAPLSHKQR